MSDALTGDAAFRSHLVRVFGAAAVASPDSPEVPALVALGKQQFPEHAADLDNLLASWRAMHGAVVAPVPVPGPAAPQPAAPEPSGPQPAAPQGSGWAGKTTPWLLTLAAAGGLLYTNWDKIGPLFENLHIPLHSTWSMLAVVVVAGFVGGLTNGYMAQSNGFLPQRPQLDGDRILLPGYLGNAVVGAAAAAFTVWLPTVATAAGESTSVPLLTSALLTTAFTAGFGGSRVLTGRRDTALLSYALQVGLARPSNPQAANQVGSTRSIFEKIEAATGISLTNPSPTGGAPVVPAAATQTDLWLDIHRGSLKSYLAGVGRPLTRDAVGLPVGVLYVVQGLGDPLRKAVQDLPLADVAQGSPDALLGVLPHDGTPPAAMQPVVRAIQDAARSAKEKLGRMPADWRLTADQLA